MKYRINTVATTPRGISTSLPDMSPELFKDIARKSFSLRQKLSISVWEGNPLMVRQLDTVFDMAERSSGMNWTLLRMGLSLHAKGVRVLPRLGPLLDKIEIVPG